VARWPEMGGFAPAGAGFRGKLDRLGLPRVTAAAPQPPASSTAAAGPVGTRPRSTWSAVPRGRVSDRPPQPPQLPHYTGRASRLARGGEWRRPRLSSGQDWTRPLKCT
jgi:hypothetical protein